MADEGMSKSPCQMTPHESMESRGGMFEATDENDYVPRRFVRLPIQIP
jgi:hypothetical protein